MTPPIVVDESGDITLYRSVEAAARAKAGLPEWRVGAIPRTAIRSESCRSPDRVMLLADTKVLQRITDNLTGLMSGGRKSPKPRRP